MVGEHRVNEEDDKILHTEKGNDRQWWRQSDKGEDRVTMGKTDRQWWRQSNNDDGGFTQQDMLQGVAVISDGRSDNNNDNDKGSE